MESESIRKWATSEHNRPIWIQIADAAAKKGGTDLHVKLATMIVATAIGL